jgi:hypothetical protein
MITQRAYLLKDPLFKYKSAELLGNYLIQNWSKNYATCPSGVVPSPHDTEETGAIGREIESRKGIGW